MTEESISLGELRAEIDRVDDAIHDLLIKRAALVGGLTTAKGDASLLRPAREMEILRRLAARHSGAFPLEVVLHIWREIMAVSLGLQMPFSVYVAGGEDDLRYWDLARFHFGAMTPFHRVPTAVHVVHDIADNPGAIGIVPNFTSDDGAPWWRLLLGAAQGGPRIAARLPLIQTQDHIDAYMIACTTQRPTGADVSLIAGLAESDLARATLTKLFAEAGIDAHVVAVTADQSGGRRHFLVQVDEFVAEDDARLAKIASKDGIFQLQGIGGYAAPLKPGAAK